MFFETERTLAFQAQEATSTAKDLHPSLAAEDFHSVKKNRTQWTEDETVALVFAWRECFVDLESHKNPAAWKRIVAEITEKGSGKTVEQAKNKIRKLKEI